MSGQAIAELNIRLSLRAGRTCTTCALALASPSMCLSGTSLSSTVRYVNTLPASVQASIKDRAKEDSIYFGYMRHEIQLPQGKELAAMTLQEVAWEVAINQMQAYGFHARLCCKNLLRPF
ncbi:LOW QUALITY PROTEIN: hypothetical protein QC762_100060 [Podospora pseudocomata]|uniref:Uncharacterized protein n=1 Tax=Podospora pseudocomata TaxID=2093779 RepID=A0ABR0GRY1_9PEZI|nr:LOW QUALITY PROTEIN: hypothetical protein QC762_100060 [Podospora pseudocomata]